MDHFARHKTLPGSACMTQSLTPEKAKAIGGRIVPRSVMKDPVTPPGRPNTGARRSAVIGVWPGRTEANRSFLTPAVLRLANQVPVSVAAISCLFKKPSFVVCRLNERSATY